MPIIELHCKGCTRRAERLLTLREAQLVQWCDSCGDQMEVSVSAPAWFRSGKYGKQGGQPTEPDRA